MERQIIITANGPGEIVGWVKPVVEEIRLRFPQCHFTIVLWPCVFASGHETRVAETELDLHWIIPPKRAITMLIRRNIQTRLFAPGKTALLLHLGGEPILSWLLARRLRCPAMAYSEGQINPLASHFFKTIFMAKQGLKQLKQTSNCRTVGNLFVDAAKNIQRKPVQFSKTDLTIGIYPGSRGYQAERLIPLFCQAARLAWQQNKTLRFVLAKSPFLHQDIFAESLTTDFFNALGSSRAKFFSRNDKEIISIDDLEIPIKTTREVMSVADLLLMLPGTCTAEAMVAAIPMLVVVPFYQCEHNAAPGIVGWMDRIPLIGKPLKRKIGYSIMKNRPLWALPNLEAGYELVPELKGALTSQHIADHLLALVNSPEQRRQMHSNLQNLAGPPGAARKIVDTLSVRLTADRDPL